MKNERKKKTFIKSVHVYPGHLKPGPVLENQQTTTWEGDSDQRST